MNHNYEMNTDRRDLLLRVAKMYYMDNMSQEQIAKEINVSRSNISKMLKTCVDEKIIEFRLNGVTSRGIEIKEKIKEMFNLKEVLLVPTELEAEKNKISVANEGALYLESVIKDKMLIGISWGTTLYHMVKQFKPANFVKADVIQLAGGIGSKSIETDGQVLARKLADALKGACYVLRAPFYVENKVLKDLFMQEFEIKSYFERFKNLDIVVTGIGHNEPVFSSLVRSGHISYEQCEYILKHGGVADICGRQIDINGNLCVTDISERIIGIQIDMLKSVPLVVGLAGGIDKKDCILAALRGGYINVLITDELTALSIINTNKTEFQGADKIVE